MIRTENSNGNVLLSLKPELDRLAKQVAPKYRLEPAELSNEFWAKQLGSSQQLHLVDGRLPNLASRLHNCAKDMLRNEPISRLRRKTLRKPKGPTDSPARNAGILAIREPIRDLGDEGQSEVRLQARIAVTDAMQQLPKSDQELIRLRCMDEFTVCEIAERTGESPECVKSRLRRTLQNCFPRLKKELS